MSIPVIWRVGGARQLEKKLNNIDKGLNNLATKNAAMKAMIVKIRNDAKRQIRNKRSKSRRG